jgi:Cell division protein CrgA
MATKATQGPGKAQKKGRSSGGRTTPSAKAGSKPATSAGSVQSQRYTPPVPKGVKSSPRWMGIAIIALFLLGVLVVILNYSGALPGGVNNLWLVAAIGSIFVGLMMATRYH